LRWRLRRCSGCPQHGSVAAVGCGSRTYALVARNWWAIERLARALIDHREPTYDEAVAVLQRL
jgi:hypothetical protein